jgi:hypothetical protein
MTSTNPWERSLRILERPGRSHRLGDGAFRVRWEPGCTVNPRSRTGDRFGASWEVMDFVRARLRRIVAGRPEPRVRFRTEPLRQAPGRQACILVVGGPFGHPPVYVKWLIDGDDRGSPIITFISFHESDRPWS